MLDYSGGSSVHTRVFKVEERGQRCQSDPAKGHLLLVDFNMEKGGHGPWNMGSLQKVGAAGKEMLAWSLQTGTKPCR